MNCPECKTGNLVYRQDGRVTRNIDKNGLVAAQGEFHALEETETECLGCSRTNADSDSIAKIHQFLENNYCPIESIKAG